MTRFYSIADAKDHLPEAVRAAEHARLERAGHTPPAADGKIAAIAVVHDLTVVTGNVKRVSDLAGVAVEDRLQAPV